jgi:hypothetical protein
VTIREHETVGDAVAIGSSLRVDGHVRGDAVALGGALVLGPTAVVEGDAVAAGGAIEVHPGAQLKGSQVSLPNAVGGVGKWLSHVHAHSQPWAGSTFWNVLFTAMRSLGLLVLGLLLLTFIPERVGTITGTMNARPWLSLAVGTALVAGLVPACVLLAITLIGIPLIPVVVAIVLGLLWLGATAVAARVGTGLPGSERRGVLLNFALGVLLIGLCDLVPWVGTLIVFTLSCAGAGAAVLSRLGSRTERPSVPPAQPPTPDEPNALAPVVPS